MVLKGISPLIATVLLIAVTMTIAGVLAYWASTFVQSGLQTSANQTVASECQFGNFIIDACSYDSVNSKMTVIVDNIGTIGLSNITIFTVYPDNSVNATQTTGSVGSGSLKSFTATGVVSGFSRVRIGTQCPNVRQETACR